VNERADIARMLDMKVDGIISDYPDRVREALKARR
jgi:glycerophosphoryl diester phosphodiesterase